MCSKVRIIKLIPKYLCVLKPLLNILRIPDIKSINNTMAASAPKIYPRFHLNPKCINIYTSFS